MFKNVRRCEVLKAKTSLLDEKMTLYLTAVDEKKALFVCR